MNGASSELVWAASSFDANQVSLQIFFDDFSQISKDGQDVLVVEFINEFSFLSQSLGLPIFDSGHQIRQPLPI